MIKSLTVTNHLGESVVLELGFPEKSGFLIRNIEGIGPNKANINMSELVTTDGSIFNSARLPARNIVLDIVFLEKPTIEHTRHLSYKYFPLKKRIKLTFETDNRHCEIYGYVESNEPNIFSERESAQISILCPDPYFYSIGTTSTVFSGIDQLFEFPFSNESLTENLIQTGEIKNEVVQDIYYSGEANVGIRITIHALGPASNIDIYNLTSQEKMRIKANLSMGDDIIISTVKGDKFAFLLQDGYYTNVLSCIDWDSDWFQLSQGSNVFTYDAESGVENLEFKIESKTVYEGV